MKPQKVTVTKPDETHVAYEWQKDGEWFNDVLPGEEVRGIVRDNYYDEPLTRTVNGKKFTHGEDVLEPESTEKSLQPEKSVKEPEPEPVVSKEEEKALQESVPSEVVNQPAIDPVVETPETVVEKPAKPKKEKADKPKAEKKK